jgi:trk system potassium uptake protein TrkH
MITLLFIIGGTGFFVIADVFRKRNIRKFSLHTKIVLVSTILLNVVSTLIIFALEYHNPHTLGQLSMGDKWWAAYFQGVVPRTAGFNTLDIGALTLPSKVYMMGLMFIGAAPGSTGGGIKITTFVLILFALWSVLTNKEEINVFRRRIPKSLVYRAFSIATSGIIFVSIIFFLLTITEKGVDMSTLLFETFSASGTVGLSANFTGDLSPVGRILITIMMFIGRVGPLTIGFVLAIRSNKQSKIRYAEEKILIG